MFEWLISPEAWVALLTLIALEIVLGIDNIIFISILVGRLPLTPGAHTVEVSFGGSGGRTVPIEVQDGGYAALVVTEPR